MTYHVAKCLIKGQIEWGLRKESLWAVVGVTPPPQLPISCLFWVTHGTVTLLSVWVAFTNRQEIMGLRVWLRSSLLA